MRWRARTLAAPQHPSADDGLARNRSWGGILAHVCVQRNSVCCASGLRSAAPVICATARVIVTAHGGGHVVRHAVPLATRATRASCDHKDAGEILSGESSSSPTTEGRLSLGRSPRERGPVRPRGPR